MKDIEIAVIGLGYVGLPLAIEFGKVYKTVGFDINQTRIGELLAGIDSTCEVTAEEILQSNMLSYSANPDDISNCNIYIITVPTPIDEFKNPDLFPLESASKTVGGFLKRDDIVIYESTVYPGATEEVCVPILEECSGLSYNQDFYCGYSPERINPGDKEHRISMIRKVTSGSTPETAAKVDALYQRIITAGTYMAESIKVAEAAKVIENTQRDVNIALINELAVIFNKLGIDTESVLNAAATKWNFLSFQPGLVGGHCIGVDPYYLTHKAISVGYQPEIILSGRRINDGMGKHVGEQVAKLMIRKRIHLVGANVLILGLAFKENTPDIRNTAVSSLIETLQEYDCNVDVYDPWISKDDALRELKIKALDKPEMGKYDAVLVAVAHDEFRGLSLKEIKAFGKENHVLYDIKYILKASEVDGRL